jgi:3-oxoacyl-[acyl-carrier protein] reductase
MSTDTDDLRVPNAAKRVAVVSGAGSGIGASIALRLAKNGYSLALIGRRESRLRATRNGVAGTGRRTCTVHVADLTVPDAIDAAARDIVNAHGSIDVVVHSAGGSGSGAGKDLAGLADALMADFRTNTLSTILLTHALIPHLRPGGGRIIAISSIAALRGGGMAYATSKAALHGWVYTMARELGPSGTTVNAIAPGFIADTEFFGDRLTAERRQNLVSQTHVGRAGVPQDVAAAVEFLASADARQITAQVLQVNGGALPG